MTPPDAPLVPSGRTEVYEVAILHLAFRMPWEFGMLDQELGFWRLACIVLFVTLARPLGDMPLTPTRVEV